MHLKELTSLAHLLSTPEKLELAEELIRMAKADGVKPSNGALISAKSYSANDVPDIEARLLKLRPSKPDTLINSIKSMYNFKGGISEADISSAVKIMNKRGLVKVGKDTVAYSVEKQKAEKSS